MRKMPIIIVSNQDLAGLTIKQQLLGGGGFRETGKEFEGNLIYKEPNTKVELITTNRRLIDTDHLNEYFTTDLLIFASKHKSESEKPSLLVHAPGNWTDDNSYGGNPYELSQTNATVIKRVLQELTINRDKKQLKFDVTSEVTHHGPTNLNAPCVFVELGSNETYWQDVQGAQVVAETIMQVLEEWPFEETYNYAIGFGGPHYASNFNKLQLHTEFAISHIAPKYVLDKLSEELVLQAIEKTVEQVKYAIFDWKGMVRAQREKVRDWVVDQGIEVLKIKEILRKSKETR